MYRYLNLIYSRPPSLDHLNRNVVTSQLMVKAAHLPKL